jgi:hypothetical protein
MAGTGAHPRLCTCEHKPRGYLLSRASAVIAGELQGTAAVSFSSFNKGEETSMKFALVIAAVATLASPALAEDVGVRVGPVGAGVTVGEGHRDYDRDRDRDRTTVIKEREPAERTTVIKKDNDEGMRSKTIIKDRD